MDIFFKNKNIQDNVLLQAINITFIAIIFHYSPIDYECDGANTLLNAKYIYHLTTDKSTFYINGTKYYDYNSCIDKFLDLENIRLLKALI